MSDDDIIQQAAQVIGERDVTLEGWERIGLARALYAAGLLRDPERDAAIWDEAVKALAWATDSGPDPLAYVAEHNPYRTKGE